MGAAPFLGDDVPSLWATALPIALMVVNIRTGWRGAAAQKSGRMPRIAARAPKPANREPDGEGIGVAVNPFVVHDAGDYRRRDAKPYDANGEATLMAVNLYRFTTAAGAATRVLWAVRFSTTASTKSPLRQRSPPLVRSGASRWGSRRARERRQRTGRIRGRALRSTRPNRPGVKSPNWRSVNP